MSEDQHPALDWCGDVPVARRFDDPYFSLENGQAETAYVFLAGNGLPERFRPGFHIAELGFGTGLNCLVALKAWQEAGIGGRLAFTTFERYPMAANDMVRALAVFPDLAEAAKPVLGALSAGELRVVTEDLDLKIVPGNARDTVPTWGGEADAWFLDGFAPAKNPELWEPALMQEVARHTAPDGTAATYSAAGTVRRALADAGFDVVRRPGFGRKCHMTVARKP